MRCRCGGRVGVEVGESVGGDGIVGDDVGSPGSAGVVVLVELVTLWTEESKSPDADTPAMLLVQDTMRHKTRMIWLIHLMVREG